MLERFEAFASHPVPSKISPRALTKLSGYPQPMLPYMKLVNNSGHSLAAPTSVRAFALRFLVQDYSDSIASNLSKSAVEPAASPLMMASPSLCLRSIIRSDALAKSFIRPFSTIPPLYAPRPGTTQSKEKAAKEKAKKKRKKHTMYKQFDLKEAEQFALCDAIRSAHPQLSSNILN